MASTSAPRNPERWISWNAASSKRPRVRSALRRAITPELATYGLVCMLRGAKSTVKFLWGRKRLSPGSLDEPWHASGGAVAARRTRHESHSKGNSHSEVQEPSEDARLLSPGRSALFGLNPDDDVAVLVLHRHVVGGNTTASAQTHHFALGRKGHLDLDGAGDASHLEGPARREATTVTELVCGGFGIGGILLTVGPMPLPKGLFPNAELVDLLVERRAKHPKDVRRLALVSLCCRQGLHDQEGLALAHPPFQIERSAPARVRRKAFLVPSRGADLLCR